MRDAVLNHRNSIKTWDDLGHGTHEGSARAMRVTRTVMLSAFQTVISGHQDFAKLDNI